VVLPVKVGSSESGEMASNMLQKFWDSALALEPPETDDDSHSDISSRLETYGNEAGRQHNPSSGLANSYLFKLKLKSRDGSERNHRLTCGTLFNPCITIHCTYYMVIVIWPHFDS
jgi:hypothetical protein